MSDHVAVMLDDELDEGTGRDFKGLDAHEAQVALEQELSADSETQNVSEHSEETENETEDSDAQDTEALLETEATSNKDDDEQPDDQGESEPTAEKAQPEELAEELSQKADPILWAEEDLVAHGRMLEALLFAAVEPLDHKTMFDRLPEGADIPTLIERVVADYAERGINLKEIDGKWRFVTATDVAHILDKERITPRKLSRAALETLAIISYHQPCTRADIEDVRGVQVAKGSLDQLLEIGWVRLRGKRRDVPGRPTLYGTTDDFLQQFGLASIEDLPGLADLKAAGLLDARLPPGFSIPSPTDGDDEEDILEEGEDAEFAQDFLAAEEEIDEIVEE